MADITRLIRNGHSELQGLLLALADWSEELRMILLEEKKPATVIIGRACQLMGGC